MAHNFQNSENSNDGDNNIADNNSSHSNKLCIFEGPKAKKMFDENIQ